MTHIQFLIGCPASGKSTLANTLIKQNANYRVVSTDHIRAMLFGDEAIQGCWAQVENEALRQITEHLRLGHSVIYDATNAKRSWRREFIQTLKELGNTNIMGLYLKTPLDVCQQWNQQRQRQVPLWVIEDHYQALQQFPPLTAEGFTAIIDIPFNDGKLDLSHLEEQLRQSEYPSD